MPTIIDSLIVTLGLDPAAFKKGSAESKKELKGLGDEGRRQAVEETKRAKEREKQAKTAAEGIHKIKLQVLGMASAMVSASGIVAFTANLTRSDAAAGRLSNNLGMTTKSLTAWQGAAEKLGSTGGDVENIFRNINQILQDRKTTGGSSAFTPLARMDPTILAKFLDDSATMEQRAIMVGEALKKVSAQDSQTYGGMANFSEGAVNFLRHQTEEINATVEAQRKLSPGDEDAEAAQKRATAWAQLTQALKQTGREIETYFTPVLVKLLDVLAGMPGAVIGVGALVTVLTTLSTIKFAATLFGIKGIASAIGTAGAAGTGLIGMLSRLVLPVSAAYGAYQIYKLGSAAKDLWDIEHRQGVTLTPRLSGSGAVTGGASVGSSGRLTRGMRNNNPGNIEYRQQAGATLEGGRDARFAVFRSMDEGVAALARQLQLYAGRGNDTLRGIIGTYAPKNENNTAAYIRSMAKGMGVGADQHLDLRNISVLRDVISGIATVENGAGRLSIGQINSGLDMFQSGRYARAGAGGSSSTDVKIGQVTIHTQATDAKGIAVDLGHAVNQYAFTAQANTGVR